MISSSKKILKFIRISPKQYVSSSGYSLVKGDTFHILKNYRIVKWEPLGGFQTVRAAEDFLNARDYENATEDKIGISTDDFAYVLEAYNFKLADEDKWIAEVEGDVLILSIDQDKLLLNTQSGSETSVQSFDNVSDLILALDSHYTDDDIYTSNAIHIINAITAAINTRDLAKNLVRVKSSNIWAYGMNLRDRKDKAGEVLVQFKGNKGGPGDVYIYYDVPLVVWRKWLSATSKGHYFWMYIRNTYQYSKLTGDKRGKLRNAVNR